ncbi:MAG: TldD/PmbA family protein [Candidatus Hydrothermarchaeota archaeon]
MEERDILGVLEDMSQAKYADIRILKQREVEVSLRNESFDFNESYFEKAVLRALKNGYSIASTDKLDVENIKKVSRIALKQANEIKKVTELIPVQPEEGSYTHPQKIKFNVEESIDFLRGIEGNIRDKLSGDFRTELILSHRCIDSHLITSEGTNVREKTPSTDFIIYILKNGSKQGYSTKIIGGIGGFEVVKDRKWEDIIEKLIERINFSLKAKIMPVSGKFDVILDSEVTGALAHEISHFLEADVYRRSFFGFENEELEIIDDPTLKNEYGSFKWDDEGVRGKKKVLIKEGEVDLLHTRLTAKTSDEAGNAHGIVRMPRPMISNVYVNPSDWREEEIFEETKSKFYVEGIVRAMSDTTDGRIEITPEIAYLIDREERVPLKHLRIQLNVSEIQKIDAIGDTCRFRPSIEKGFMVSEGGPYVRIQKVLVTS